MIALNEIIKNKEWFENRFALMGKSFNLDKIIELENKFIVINNQSNNLRAECNKLCSSVPKIASQKQVLKMQIKNINRLNKTILNLENKSKKAMSKINRLLSSLPNPAMQTNMLNLVVESKENDKFSKEIFIDEINKIMQITALNSSITKHLNQQKNVVLKEEALPNGLIKNSKKTTTLLLFFTDNAKSYLEKIETILICNSKYLIEKSVQNLSHNASREILAILSNNTRITIEFWDEFVSRDLGLKYYSKNTDMTKFVQMIKITCN